MASKDCYALKCAGYLLNLQGKRERVGSFTMSTDFRSASIPQMQERFQEQLRLAQFGKDVGLAMCQGDNLPDMLRQCTEAMVRHLDGAFARIWTLNEADNRHNEPGRSR